MEVPRVNPKRVGNVVYPDDPDMRRFSYLRWAKPGSDYRLQLEAAEEAGECIFCNLEKYHHLPILQRYEDWSISLNQFPSTEEKSGKAGAMQFVIIPKRHMESFSDLTDKDMEAMQHLANWAIKQYGLRGGALAMRFGDPRVTGATLKHFHAHLIYPEIDDMGRANPPFNWYVG